MEKLFNKKQSSFYENSLAQVIQGDSFQVLTKIKSESVDMIFADPPYFLSNDGITCKGGKMVSVNKEEWDKIGSTSTQISDKHKFNRKWIKLCKRVLKPNGTIWISGTLHNIYSIGMALEQEGFKIINLNYSWISIRPNNCTMSSKIDSGSSNYSEIICQKGIKSLWQFLEELFSCQGSLIVAIPAVHTVC